MIDYQVFLLDNMKTNEVVTQNEDGTYSIFINNRLCEQKQVKSFNHAIKHIVGCDFEKEDVQSVETVAHEDVTP